jgi:hypothetical protein
MISGQNCAVCRFGRQAFRADQRAGILPIRSAIHRTKEASMAGGRYYDGLYRGHGYDRHSYGQGGYAMGPGWEWRSEGDPNWGPGGYRGQRMGGDGTRQAGYGHYRFQHQYDLGAYGGFDGRYDLPEGWWDRDGAYHEQYEHFGRGPRAFPVSEPPRLQGGEGGGGVRYDREYLRQYNAYSPGLEGGPRRSWGYAPGPDAPSMRREHGGRSDERTGNGYNRGGFSEGHYPGPGTRQGYPPQRGGR